MRSCGGNYFVFSVTNSSFVSDRDFWVIVHALPLEDKKKLLRFATGSDRVPIRGLSNLVFVISRNGPDSDRLPTAHTW